MMNSYSSLQQISHLGDLHKSKEYCTCLYPQSIFICCISKTLSHRLCSNNISDVAQKVMLHMQHILPKGKYSNSYRKKVERPSCFCQKENTTSQLLRICQIEYICTNIPTFISTILNVNIMHCSTRCTNRSTVENFTISPLPWGIFLKAHQRWTYFDTHI